MEPEKISRIFRPKRDLIFVKGETNFLKNLNIKSSLLSYSKCGEKKSLRFDRFKKQKTSWVCFLYFNDSKKMTHCLGLLSKRIQAFAFFSVQQSFNHYLLKGLNPSKLRCFRNRLELNTFPNATEYN